MTAAEKSNAHELDDELLIRYSIYVSAPDDPDFDGRRLSEEEIRFVSTHLPNCPQCQERFDQLCADYTEIDQYLADAGFPDMAEAGRQPEKQPFSDAVPRIGRNIKASWMRYAVGAAVVVLLVAGWLFLGPTDATVRLADIDKNDFATVMRGELPELIASGLSALQQNRPEAAIVDFRRFIVEHGSDPQVYFAHYVLGASYLLQARNDLPGQLAGFDPDFIDRALLNLEIARDGSDNSGVVEDCHWFIGKAYIMKSEWQLAEESMLRVIELRGRRLDEAEKLVEAIRETRESG